jgi:hypothetical protein
MGILKFLSGGQTEHLRKLTFEQFNIFPALAFRTIIFTKA